MGITLLAQKRRVEAKRKVTGPYFSSNGIPLALLLLSSFSLYHQISLTTSFNSNSNSDHNANLPPVITKSILESESESKSKSKSDKREMNHIASFIQPLQSNDSVSAVASPPPKSKPKSDKPNVVCTYLRGNFDKYLIGAIVLLESVRSSAAGNSDDIRTAVVCHTSVNNSTRSLLTKLGHDVIVVEDVHFDPKSLPSKRFKNLIQKYTVLNLVQYNKALFVDSDAYIVRPENLIKLFHMLDDNDDNNDSEIIITWDDEGEFKPSNLPVGYKRYSYTYNESSTVVMPVVTSESRKERKIFLGPDFGHDRFNTGVILYKPQSNMFEDFQLFLKEEILTLEPHNRAKLVRSTQRLFAEFLLFPTTTMSLTSPVSSALVNESENYEYNLYNLCPRVGRYGCNRAHCNCAIHAYIPVMDCNRDKKILESVTVVHFAGSILDYESLCAGDRITTKSSSKTNDDDDDNDIIIMNTTIGTYFEKVRAEHKTKSNFNLDCHIPIIQNIRNLYFNAIQRVTPPLS
jgi:hypothetical protein